MDAASVAAPQEARLPDEPCRTRWPSAEEFERAVREALFEPPWWWQATGRTPEEWQQQKDRAALANRCPAVIHAQPIHCELSVGPVGRDGLARCADPFIAHVLRPTDDPDWPWQDTGRRERRQR